MAFLRRLGSEGPIGLAICVFLNIRVPKVLGRRNWEPAGCFEAAPFSFFFVSLYTAGTVRGEARAKGLAIWSLEVWKRESFQCVQRKERAIKQINGTTWTIQTRLSGCVNGEGGLI